jgi:AcrR family transcriptional regulator
MANKDTREHMIESTAGLVHRLGFHGTSLNEVLTESGAPRGSLYYHFPGGKEQLVLETTRRGVATVTQLLKEALTGSPDPAEGATGRQGARCERGLGYLVWRVRRATIEVRGKTPSSATSWTP